MALNPTFNYKTEKNRYWYYYQRLQLIYHQPVAQVSAAVLFTIGTIIFFSVFAIRPTLQTIAELLKKISDQQIVLTKAQTKAAALSTAQQQYDNIQPDLPILTAAIPEGYDLQNLLLQIEATAAQLAIPISNFHISDIQYPPAITKTDPIQEMTFAISVKAPFPTIETFLKNLQLLPRLISVESVSLSVPDTTDKNTNKNTLQANIGCRVYYVQASESKP